MAGKELQTHIPEDTGAQKSRIWFFNSILRCNSRVQAPL
jgi:hypothetical protein